jgi:hypothetical protein
VRWRPLTTAERQLALLWGGLVLAVLALKPLWLLAAPLLRPCVFLSVTGIPCPTCGATRSLAALMDGQILEGLVHNPLVVGATIAFLVGGMVVPLWAWRRGNAPVIATPIPMWTRLGIVALITANWAWVIWRP